MISKINLGLSWLWRTWQETAPGYQAPRQRPQTQQQQTLSFDDDFDDDQQGSSGNTAGGLIYPSSQSVSDLNNFFKFKNLTTFLKFSHLDLMDF